MHLLYTMLLGRTISQTMKYNVRGITMEINELLAKDQLENVTKLLGGKLMYLVCSDKYTEHRKIVIEYDAKKKR